MRRRPATFNALGAAVCVAILGIGAATLACGPAEAFQIHHDSSAASIGGAATRRAKPMVAGAARLSGQIGGGRRLPKPGVFGPRTPHAAGARPR
jgi:hypothetical protein